MGVACIQAVVAEVAVPPAAAGRNWHPETQVARTFAAPRAVALELAAREQELELPAAVPPELVVVALAPPVNNSVAGPELDCR